MILRLVAILQQGRKYNSFFYHVSIALSLDDQTGNFEVGKDFDALRVNVTAPGGPIDLIQSEEPKVSSGALS